MPAPGPRQRVTALARGPLPWYGLGMEITRTTPTDWVDADASDEAQAQADGYSLYPTRPMMVPTDSAALHAWLDQAEAPRHPARSHTLSCLAAGRCPAGEPC